MALDTSMRNQLIEARERISAQLEELQFRATAKVGRGGPPDYRNVYAELENELHEIEEILRNDEEEDQT